MKEDILEQMGDEYLQHKGYFTRHNIKFRPAGDHAEYDTRQDVLQLGRQADAGSIPQTGIELAPLPIHAAGDLGRA